MPKDTILTVNVVEPALVGAVNKHALEMGRELKGLVLVNESYADTPNRPRDTSGLFEEVICDFNDLNQIQTILKPYVDRLLAATCRYESSVLPFRQLVPFLTTIPTPSESSLLWSTEKPLMRDRLANYDSDLVPKYKFLEEKEYPELLSFVNNFKYPLIVKPAGLAEALLVTRCNNEGELLSCVQNTFRVIGEIYKREHRHQKPGILIEEMMQGDMYSTDVYVMPYGDIFCLPLVKVITAESLGLPGFYSYRHILPTDLSELETTEAFEAAEKSIKALNLTASTAHVEMFHTSEGWKIIEVGARIGGYREPLYREAYGISHFYNDLAVRMGKQPEMPGTALKFAAGINMYADEEGVIESIEGVAAANGLASSVFIKEHAKPGDKALFAGNGGQLIVDGILSNKSAEILENDVAKVRELVKINILPKESS